MRILRLLSLLILIYEQWTTSFLNVYVYTKQHVQFKISLNIADISTIQENNPISKSYSATWKMFEGPMKPI